MARKIPKLVSNSPKNRIGVNQNVRPQDIKRKIEKLNSRPKDSPILSRGMTNPMGTYKNDRFVLNSKSQDKLSQLVQKNAPPKTRFDFKRGKVPSEGLSYKGSLRGVNEYDHASAVSGKSYTGPTVGNPNGPGGPGLTASGPNGPNGPGPVNNPPSPPMPPSILPPNGPTPPSDGGGMSKFAVGAIAAGVAGAGGLMVGGMAGSAIERNRHYY